MLNPPKLYRREFTSQFFHQQKSAAAVKQWRLVYVHLSLMRVTLGIIVEVYLISVDAILFYFFLSFIFQLPDKSIASLVRFYYSWKKTRSKTSVMDRHARKQKRDREER